MTKNQHPSLMPRRPFLLRLALALALMLLATTTHAEPAGECTDDSQRQGGGGPKRVDVESRPNAPKLGDVMTNVKSKMPAEVPGWMAGVWSRVSTLAAPHVRKLVEYGGEVLKPGEELAERCHQKRRKATTSSSSRSSSSLEAGLDACALLDVSWSLGRQLGSLSKNASAKTASWLAQEVPRVALPFHLLWVDLAVDVSPVTGADVRSLILHQRPYWVVQVCDFFSETVAKLLHSIPFFDFAINARYDLLYVPDAACPLTQKDGVVVRAPLTADGFCEVRPCERQSSIAGQLAVGGANPFCECDLPNKRCRLRAEPLRDFQLLVDEPLASKRFDAQAATSVAWVTVPTWFPETWQVALQGLLPRYLFNGLVGVALLYLAEPLAESLLFHIVIAMFLGLFSGLIIAGMVFNHALRTIKRLQPFSNVATLMTSLGGFFLYQRFGRESVFPLVQQLLTTLWADPKGQLLMVGSAVLGVMLGWGLGWFRETEDEARERPGWLRVYFNGQHNIRVGLIGLALCFLCRAVPTPDLGALIVVLVLCRGTLGHFAHRLHMYLHRSPDTHRFLAQPYEARIGDEGEGENEDNTAAELDKLRAYIRSNPEATHRLRHGKGT